MNGNWRIGKENIFFRKQNGVYKFCAGCAANLNLVHVPMLKKVEKRIDKLRGISLAGHNREKKHIKLVNSNTARAARKEGLGIKK